VSRLKETKVMWLNPSKAQTVQTFVWEPSEGFNLEPRFFTGTPSKPKIKKLS
jgi:hypothetical protein